MLTNQSHHCDRYIPLSEAAKRCYPRAIHASGAWRHARKGILCANGQRVYLKHIRAGGVIYTTPEWVTAFFEAAAAADAEHFRGDGNVQPVAKARTPDQSTRAIAVAREKLRALGV